MVYCFTKIVKIKPIIKLVYILWNNRIKNGNLNRGTLML